MVVQPCESNYKHWLEHFKCMNCVVYELYPNKSVKNKREKKPELEMFPNASLKLNTLLYPPATQWVAGSIQLSQMFSLFPAFELCSVI